jgi:hypothetical protein
MASKKPAPTIAMSFDEDLRPLFGLAMDDPEVSAVLARAGKVTWTKPDGGARYAVAKDAGFDLLVQRPPGAKRGAPMIVRCAFMFVEGSSKHRQFARPPHGLAFTTRAQILASMPAPERTWVIGTGAVPTSTEKVDHDRWLLDGLHVSADYDQELNVRVIQVQIPD